jgi:tRNA pseudouridine13 synthase
VVDECLGHEPAGTGAHAWLRVRKRAANTEQVARRIAQLAGVPLRDVGYAGLKDRNAICSQWFSVNLQGRTEPDWTALGFEGVAVLEAKRHGRKLRRGAFEANRFHIVVRDLRGEWGELAARLGRIAARGVPNYFGEQRFGRGGANAARAYEMLRGRLRVRDRHERSLFLSTARSLLFNRVLSHRVRECTWDVALPGEIVMLDGSHSVFRVGEPGADTVERLKRLDVHPTGPLWGRVGKRLSDEALVREGALLQSCGVWRRGLEEAGLAHARRSLRLKVSELIWERSGADGLELGFSLPSGSYATAVLRELVRSD